MAGPTPDFTFYRNNYRLFIWSAIVLLIISFVILGTIFYNKFTQPTPSYFATTSDGRLIEVTPNK